MPDFVDAHKQIYLSFKNCILNSPRSSFQIQKDCH